MFMTICLFVLSAVSKDQISLNSYKGLSLGFMCCSISRVIVGQVPGIVTCGSQTQMWTDACA